MSKSKEAMEIARVVADLQPAPCLDDYIGQVAAAIESSPAWIALMADRDRLLVHIYNAGYLSGHHDTVESQFTDIFEIDIETENADIVAELRAALTEGQ